MLLINTMPCSTCKNYKGVKQPDGTEKSEYIYCKVAKENDAKNLLTIKNGKPYCPKYFSVEE